MRQCTKKMTGSKRAGRRNRRFLVTLFIAMGITVSGCALSHRTGHEFESPHAADDLGVTLLTHEQATAEVNEMLKLLTDFMPIKIGEADTAYKQQCVLGETDVSNGASDFSGHPGAPVENFEEYAHRFVEQLEAQGYVVQSLWPHGDMQDAWFSYMNQTGTSIGVDLYPDRSIVAVYSRCYEYDWPELTPTPTPSVTPDG